ncbi:MAG: hypothetical protein HGB08_00155 [Candidatus Moranbacteria bacterium]|nr:hypothetical protein [Candidatus Moranbacteria bacterium]
MPIEVLGQEAVKKMLELGRNPYRPPEITKLQEEIQGEMRVAGLRMSVYGIMNEEAVERITRMKFELDALYAAWFEGRIE